MSIKSYNNVELKKYITRKGIFSRTPIPKKLKTLEPEIRLGRAILDTAVLDGCSMEAGIEEYLDAYAWFDEEDEDFQLICFMAYLEPDLVVRYFREVHDCILKNKKIGDLLEQMLTK